MAEPPTPSPRSPRRGPASVLAPVSAVELALNRRRHRKPWVDPGSRPGAARTGPSSMRAGRMLRNFPPGCPRRPAIATACRQGTSGNMPRTPLPKSRPGRRPCSRTRGRPGWRPMCWRPGRRRRRSRSFPGKATRSACSASTAMFGSGPIAAGSGPMRRRRTRLHGGIAALGEPPIAGGTKPPAWPRICGRAHATGPEGPRACTGRAPPGRLAGLRRGPRSTRRAPRSGRCSRLP